MASISPNSKKLRSTARRSLPVPSTRTSSAQRSSHGSPSTRSSRDLTVTKPSGVQEAAQRSFPALGTKPKIPEPPSSPAQHAMNSRPGTGSICSRPSVRGPESASPSIAKPSNLPRARHPNALPVASKITTPSTGYGSLTPVNALDRLSLRGRDDLATPKCPRQYHHRLSVSAAPVQTPSKKPLSPYQNTHCADPCIPGCLIHQMSPCGHKVMTTKPEPCASNCHRPLVQRAVSAFTNILQSTEAFVCAACVEIHVQSHKEMKAVLWGEQMDRTEVQMGGLPPDWREEQNNYWQRVWQNDIEAERRHFEKLGRKCCFIPGEPLRVGDAMEVVAFPSVASPWPPLKRPLAKRSTKRVDPVASVVTGLESG